MWFVPFASGNQPIWGTSLIESRSPLRSLYFLILGLASNFNLLWLLQGYCRFQEGTNKVCFYFWKNLLQLLKLQKIKLNHVAGLLSNTLTTMTLSPLLAMEYLAILWLEPSKPKLMSPSFAVFAKLGGCRIRAISIKLSRSMSVSQ